MLGRIRMKIILNNPNLLFSKTNPPLFSNFFASIPLPRRKERILIVLTIGFSGETIFGFFFQFICCNKNSTRMDQMQVLGRWTSLDKVYSVLNYRKGPILRLFTLPVAKRWHYFRTYLYTGEIKGNRAVVVTQLVERSLPTLEVLCLNPVIGKFHILATVLRRQK